VFLGRILAFVGGIYFLANGQFQAVILAAFVLLAGSMELRQVRGEGQPRGIGPGDGIIDVPPPEAGFRWVDFGDGILRQVPIMAHAGGRGRSWN